MIFQMTPYSYMTFYHSDRRFFIKDSANGLYAPSAYQLGTLTAGEALSRFSQIPDPWCQLLVAGQTVHLKQSLACCSIIQVE